MAGMDEHYARLRRNDSDLVLIAGSDEDRLDGLDMLLAIEPGFTMLDIGCHQGIVAGAMADRGASVIHAVDLHRPSLAIAEDRLAGHDAVVRELDLCEGMDGLRRVLPLRERYDVLLYLGIYHHMARQMPEDALSRFVSELFPLAGRYLAIRTPVRFMERLREEPALRAFRKVDQCESRNSNVSPVSIYEPC